MGGGRRLGLGAGTRLVVSTEEPVQARNPGPSWGYRFLRLADKVLPEAVYRPARAAGTLIAMAGMARQRRHSREYLAAVLGRPPANRDVFRHFFTFEESLMQRLRVSNGRDVVCEFAPGSEDFRSWLRDGGPVLLGTMHVGASDLLGFQLVGRSRAPVYLVREKVGNSHDTEALAAVYGDALRFLWVNDASDFIFALKEAAASAGAIAIQCDRVSPGIRTEAFRFLGARRLFPFSIYHLSLILGRPVILSFGIQAGRTKNLLHCSPRFERRPGEARAEALARARLHFQGFLDQLEAVLREQPWVWFNFLPLNQAVNTPGGSTQ